MMESKIFQISFMIPVIIQGGFTGLAIAPVIQVINIACSAKVSFDRYTQFLNKARFEISPVHLKCADS